MSSPAIEPPTPTGRRPVTVRFERKGAGAARGRRPAEARCCHCRGSFEHTRTSAPRDTGRQAPAPSPTPEANAVEHRPNSSAAGDLRCIPGRAGPVAAAPPDATPPDATGSLGRWLRAAGGCHAALLAALQLALLAALGVIAATGDASWRSAVLCAIALLLTSTWADRPRRRRRRPRAPRGQAVRAVALAALCRRRRPSRRPAGQRAARAAAGGCRSAGRPAEIGLLGTRLLPRPALAARPPARRSAPAELGRAAAAGGCRCCCTGCAWPMPLTHRRFCVALLKRVGAAAAPPRSPRRDARRRRRARRCRSARPLSPRRHPRRRPASAAPRLPPPSRRCSRRASAGRAWRLLATRVSATAFAIRGRNPAVDLDVAGVAPLEPAPPPSPSTAVRPPSLAARRRVREQVR